MANGTKQLINPENPLITKPKQDYLYKLIQDNTPLTECAKLTGYHIKHVRRLNKMFRESNLTHPKTRKSAFTALDNILKGKAFGDIENIPASVTMSAVKEVYDRVHPKTTINLSKVDQTITHVKIDMSEFQGAESHENGRSLNDAYPSIPDAEIVED